MRSTLTSPAMQTRNPTKLSVGLNQDTPRLAQRQASKILSWQREALSLFRLHTQNNHKCVFPTSCLKAVRHKTAMWMGRLQLPCVSRIGMVVAMLLSCHAGLLAWNAWCHSPVATEMSCLPAGLSHLKLGRFDLYRVNPPLVRTVAAIPAYCAAAATDWSNYDLNPLRRS